MKTLTERIHEAAIGGNSITLTHKESVKVWALLVTAKDWHNSDGRQKWGEQADDREEGLLRSIVTEIIEYEEKESCQ